MLAVLLVSIVGVYKVPNWKTLLSCFSWPLCTQWNAAAAA